MAGQQPLHTLITSVAAPSLILSREDGSIGHPDLTTDGACGLHHADRRVLSLRRLDLVGHALTPLTHHTLADGDRFSALAESAHVTQDPQLRLDVRRTLTPGVLHEEITLTNLGDEDQPFELVLTLGSDLAGLADVRAGVPRERVALEPVASVDQVIWRDEDAAYAITATQTEFDLSEPTLIRLRWTGSLAPHTAMTTHWQLDCVDASGVVQAAPGAGLDVTALADTLSAPVPEAVRPAAHAWLTRSLHDLNGLRMATTDRPEDAFFAAGAPWYLTLFGRDSLWTARMLAPHDLAHAASTLRTLAARQGTKDDPAGAEQPGKICHELRREALDLGEMVLPPLYFGTIDATALWVCLLVDVWRLGLDRATIAELEPNLRAALGWITGPADADGDGFAEYIDATGHGLANQGWKDSADSVRFSDGRQAVGPVALCEVQGYAHEAVTGAADLFDELGDSAYAAELRAWASALAERFRAQFWVDRDGDRFVALALDGAKQPVDAVTSNMGHLLGTGLLTADEEALIARRLVADDMLSGFGLRTMSAREGGYSPLSYHCGSVWPHDTAIAIRGLRRGGFTAEARLMAEQLLAAAAHWHDRLPELWSGEELMTPYPTSCRPQAWSAAAALEAVSALG